jgi:hypothetical protein
MSSTEPTVTELTVIETIEINPSGPEQQEAPEPEAARKAYLCRHIFVDGHQCGSRALRGQNFCYYHYAHRTPVLASQRRRRPKSGFDLRRLDGLDNHAAIQLAISEVLGRIANEAIDRKSGWLLLYGLQIAGHNLRHARPNPEAPVPDTIVEDGTFGQLAEVEPGRTVPPSPLEQMRALLDKDPNADIDRICDLLDEDPNAGLAELTDRLNQTDLPLPKVQT